MKTNDLRDMDDKGLVLHRNDLVGEMLSLNFRSATGQVEDTSAAKKTRRAIARVNTIIRERELAAGLNPGGLEQAVGKLESADGIFGAFRKAMGASAEG